MDQESRVILLVRSDLEMNEGKIAVQAAHAVQLLIFEHAIFEEDKIIIPTTPMLSDWLKGIYKKITLKVKSERQLIAVCDQARELGIPSVIVEDLGLTCFNGVKTKTVAAFGPVYKEMHDPITRKLRML